MARNRKRLFFWLRDELRKQGHPMPERPSSKDIRAAIEAHGIKPAVEVKAAKATARVKAQLARLDAKPKPGEQFVDGEFARASRPVIKIKRRRAIGAAEEMK